MTANFTDDMPILAIHEDPAIASMKLQANINKINDWARKWRIKTQQRKSMQITFTTLIYPRKMNRNSSQLKADMGKAHQIKKKIAQPKSKTNALATQKKINIINRKQTPPIQSSIQTNMDL
jgi:hypothetical protein